MLKHYRIEDLPYLAARGPHPGPLFVMANGDYLTRQLFASRLSAVLEQAGFRNSTILTAFA